MDDRRHDDPVAVEDEHDHEREALAERASRR
jgi:hypothetical protein